jgi:hypothetical protein
MDRIVKSGSRPWLPNSLATNSDVWHEDDVPVIGVFEMAGEKVLFIAVGGVASEVTVWAYLPLSPAEYFELDDEVFDSVGDMVRKVENRFKGRRFAIALAKDFVLGLWTSLESPADSIYTASTAFLEDTVRALDVEVRTAAERMLPPQDLAAVVFKAEDTMVFKSEYVRSRLRSGAREQVEDFLIVRGAAEVLAAY